MTRDPAGWMQTFTGRAFWPLDPHVDDIDPVDIAHALAHLCRYGGHTRRFYSVAEHCVLMSLAVDRKHALWALLHDATEAYVVDVPRPLKHQLPDYMAAEARVAVVIAQRFGLDPVEPPEVKVADNRILLTERNALLTLPPPRPWPPALEALEPLDVRITGWEPVVAKYRYLDRLRQLGVS
jgi:hypothetical protein